MSKEEKVILVLAIAALIAAIVFRVRPYSTADAATISDEKTATDTSTIGPAYLTYNLPIGYWPVMGMAKPILAVNEGPDMYAGYSGCNGCM